MLAGRSAISESELLLHCSSHPKLDYIAREEELSRADGLFKHYIGVYDSQTSRLELVEARKVVVRGTLRTDQKATASNGTNSQSESAPTVCFHGLRSFIQSLTFLNTTDALSPLYPRTNLWYQEISKSNSSPDRKCYHVTPKKSSGSFTKAYSRPSRLRCYSIDGSVFRLYAFSRRIAGSCRRRKTTSKTKLERRNPGRCVYNGGDCGCGGTEAAGCQGMA